MVLGRLVTRLRAPRVPSAPTSGAERGDRDRMARSGPIWALTAALLLGAAVLTVGVLPHTAPPAAPVVIPWWLLAPAYLLAEVCVVHYDFRKQAHSFSLTELPLVLGLFFAAPQDVVVAVVLGVGAALVLRRRQSGLKLLFNIGNSALGACVAVLVFRGLAGPVVDSTPGDWLAALAAVLTTTLLCTAAIVAAIWQAEGGPDVRRLPDQVGLALFNTTGGATLGLMGVSAAWHHPAALALLAVPVGVFFLSHRNLVLQRQERDRLELLHRTASALDEARDVVSGLTQVLQSACVTFHAEAARLAVVAQHDPDLVLVVTATAEAAGSGGYVGLDDLDPVLRRALGSTRPEIVDLPEATPDPLLMAPLGNGSTTRGALVVGGRLGPGSGFRGTDLQLLATLARHVEISLDRGRLARALAETAQRAERERENALVLQRGILPPALSPVPDAGVAVRYLPGTAGAEVGGDWYDVIPLPDGDVGFAIGDVLGHDLEAAARMGQARSALRAYASDGHPPAAVVERLNRLLTRTDPEFMGTCCYLQFSPARSSVTLVSAGHPPPLLLVPGQRPQLLEVEANLPLGVHEDVRYAHTSVHLGPGATLVLYTDGLVETRTMPLEVGLSRLTALPATAADDELEVLAERVLATAPVGALGDDLTLLLLRHQPSTAHTPLAGAAPAGA